MENTIRQMSPIAIMNGFAKDAARSALGDKSNPFKAFDGTQLSHIYASLFNSLDALNQFHSPKLMVELFGMAQLELHSRSYPDRVDWEQELDDKLRFDMQTANASRED